MILWVLRKTAILFGMGVIGLTGMLGISSDQREPTALVLFVEHATNNQDTNGLFLLGLGSALRQRILPPSYSFQALTWSPDRRWLYGMRYPTQADAGQQQAVVWRISRNAASVDTWDNRVVSVQHGAFVISPDGQWAVFVERNPNGNHRIVRARARDGSHRRILAEFHQSLFGFSSYYLKVSDDGRWVYFWDDAKTVRVPFAGGPYEMLTDYPRNVRLVAITPEHLLFSGGKAVYFTDRAGQNRQMIFQYGPESQSEPLSITQVIWLENLNWIVMEGSSGTENFLQAYDGSDGSLLWRHSGLLLVETMNAEGWLVATDSLGNIFGIGADTYDQPIKLLQQGDYLYFPYTGHVALFARAIGTLRPDGVGENELWRLFTDGETQKIYEPVALMTTRAFSPDGQWAAFDDYDTSAYTILVKLDGTQSHQLRDGYFMDWLPPIDRKWSPAGLLIVGGGALVAGAVVGLKRRGKVT